MSPVAHANTEQRPAHLLRSDADCRVDGVQAAARAPMLQQPGRKAPHETPLRGRLRHGTSGGQGWAATVQQHRTAAFATLRDDSRMLRGSAAGMNGAPSWSRRKHAPSAPIWRRIQAVSLRRDHIRHARDRVTYRKLDTLRCHRIQRQPVIVQHNEVGGGDPLLDGVACKFSHNCDGHRLCDCAVLGVRTVGL